jgi:N-acetylneuraminate synthase
MVEFHLDLEGEGDEYQSGHCWLPEQIQETIAQVRTGLSADGSGRKAPSSIEQKERSWRADPEDGLRPLRSIRSQWSPLV